MGRKRILISDPVVSQMNPTQWVWEAESAIIAEEDRVEELKAIFDIVKTTTIRMLGLNLNPIEEEDGKLRPPEDNEIIPLSIWCGTETILGEVLERNKQMVEQESIEASIGSGKATNTSEMTPDELDAFMNSTEGLGNIEDMGDIDFDEDVDLFKNREWTSVTARAARKQLIQVLDDVPGINKKSKVVIKEIDEDNAVFNKPTDTVIKSVDEVD